MKTLKLSGFALLLMSLFSCTKTSNSLDQSQQAVRVSNNTNTSPSGKIQPSLQIQFNPETGVVGQNVTVTGTIVGTNPDCGKLHLNQIIDGQSYTVASVEVTSSVQSITYNFTPEVAGTKAYEFQLQFIPDRCPSFGEAMSSSYFLNVIEACHGLTLTGKVAHAQASTNGNYFFTVEYTVNTCSIQYNHLKTQGGVTAFTTSVVDASAEATIWNVGKSDHPNSIIKWEESAPVPGNTKTYTFTFIKPWSGTGPVQLTGDWSVHADLNGVDAGTATFPAIYYQ